MAYQIDESPDYMDLTVRSNDSMISFAVIDDRDSVCITVAGPDGKRGFVELPWDVHCDMFGHLQRVAKRLIDNKRKMVRNGRRQ